MKMQEELMKQAVLARENSYSPYSKFKVGAAALLKNGEIIKGTNIENASYGLSNCAERVCLGNVYSKGYKKEDIIGFAISGETSDFISPCGACRQVMMELLLEKCNVFLMNSKNEFKEVTVGELLPFSFKGDVING